MNKSILQLHPLITILYYQNKKYNQEYLKSYTFTLISNSIILLFNLAYILK